MTELKVDENFKPIIFPFCQRGFWKDMSISDGRRE